MAWDPECEEKEMQNNASAGNTTPTPAKPGAKRGAHDLSVITISVIPFTNEETRARRGYPRLCSWCMDKGSPPLVTGLQGLQGLCPTAEPRSF